jgi:type IV fimbrial biogenesis protein FimT
LPIVHPFSVDFITIARMTNYSFACRADRGITLIETMVALTIMGILLMVAVPAYQSTIEANRRITYATELLEDLTLARSEAIKRNRQVVVCASSTGTTCVTAPGGTPSDWKVGWMSYVDMDGDGLFDAGETILRAHPALNLPTGWVATHNFTTPTVRFRPTGEFSGIGSTGFRICIVENSVSCNASIPAGVKYANIVAIAAGRMRIESQ